MRTWRSRHAHPPGPGPWADEPDGAQWVEHDVDCLAVRNAWGGHWCGYVGVPPGHPWHGQDADDITALIHNGEVTWAAARHRFYRREPGRPRPADLWWVGFHCHAYDELGPTREYRYRQRGGLAGWPGDDFADGLTYRTLRWVQREVAALALQVAVPEIRQLLTDAIDEAREQLAAMAAAGPDLRPEGA